jgi:cytoskeleton protein RodZ
MTEIGATLREARMRARIDVSEIEAKTKIRAKYLRALENEEWDLLPGPTFVRTFLRTYAQALDLDAKTLVEEYRRRYEPPVDVEHQPVVSTQRTQQRARQRPGRSPSGRSSRGYLIAIGVVGVVIVLLLVGLLSGKGGGSPNKASGTVTQTASTHTHSTVTPVPTGSKETGTSSTRVALSLHPSAPVYVCLIGDGGNKRIPGLILQPTYTPVTYHASRFELTLGNSSITMYVNGKPLTVPASSKPIGYTITASGRHTLPASQQPTCQ